MKYTKTRVLKKAIPDNDPNGLVDRITVHRNLTIKDVSVSVDIKHPYNGDISVEITGPEGQKKTIQSPTRVPGKNLKKTYSGKDTEALIKGKSKGEWTIRVIDSGARDSGHLEDWSLELDLANSKTSEIFIDDNENLKSTQICHQGGKITSMTGHVDIQHTHIGDLVCILTSPSGKKVTLHNKSGGSQSNLKKQFSAQDLKDFNGEVAKGKWQMDISDTLKGDAGKLVKWGLNIKTSTQTAAPKKKSNAKDDLTKIEGIGPKIKEILWGGGILSFEDLASSNFPTIKKLLDAAGPRFKMHDPGSWPRQSRLAADGKWDELKKLQDELDGGK